MPIIEYQCRNGHRTEQLFWPTETVPGIVVCEVCAAEANRLVSRFRRKWADGCDPSCDDLNAENRAFLRSEEGQRMIKNEELIPASEIPHWSEGEAGSSCSLTRMLEEAEAEAWQRDNKEQLKNELHAKGRLHPDEMMEVAV